MLCCAGVCEQELEPSIEVEHLYLTPDPRKAVGALRRRLQHVDVFVNQYDLSDAAGAAMAEFMEKNGVAFTGAGGKFYDPPREDLKRLCRYYGIDTPNYCFLSDAKVRTEALARRPSVRGWE